MPFLWLNYIHTHTYLYTHTHTHIYTYEKCGARGSQSRHIVLEWVFHICSPSVDSTSSRLCCTAVLKNPVCKWTHTVQNHVVQGSMEYICMCVYIYSFVTPWKVLTFPWQYFKSTFIPHKSSITIMFIFIDNVCLYLPIYQCLWYYTFLHFRFSLWDYFSSLWNRSFRIFISGIYWESWRRKWQPTPVLLPGELHGKSSVGCSPRGHKGLDTTEWAFGINNSSFLFLENVCSSPRSWKTAFSESTILVWQLLLLCILKLLFHSQLAFIVTGKMCAVCLLAFLLQMTFFPSGCF